MTDKHGDGGTIDRRRFVELVGASGVAGLAGCLGGGGSSTNVSNGGSGANESGSTNGSGGGDAQYTLRVGTSAGGTRDVGLAVQRAVSQHSDALNYSTVESPGYIGTIFRMAQGQFDAGITDNNSLIKALDNRGRFGEREVEQVPYYGFFAFPYSIYVLARDGTGIETFDDLAGANVYPAEPGYSTRATTLDVWSQQPTQGVYDQMNIQNMGVDSAPGAMEEGTIDAAIAYGTPGVRYTGWVREYASRVDVHYVEPTDALIESAKAYQGAAAGRTPYSEWGLEQDIGAEELFHWDLQVNYTFNPAANNDAVAELCRVVYEHNETVNNAQEQFNDFDSVASMYDSAVTRIPVHPGAVQYYREQNAWDDGLEVGGSGN